MERLNWKEIVLTSETSPDLIEGMQDYISMKGALDIFIHRGRPLPDRLYSMTSDIETNLRKSFPNLHIIGEENVNEVDPQYPGTRYWGQIYGSDGSGVIARIQMSASETRPPFELETLLKFFVVLPLGDYQKQTEEALQGIWQHIRGFDYVFPGGSSGITQDKQGDQSILLIRHGNPIASGQYAIQEARLPVEPKKRILMSEGILI